MDTKMTVADLRAMKARGEKITMLTAYDASFARLLEGAGIDVLLVGDSLGMVMLGYDSTVPVTMEEMIHHAKAVRRGAQRSLVIGDMPFLSYQVSPQEAIHNAGRLMKEAGCDAVKVEGGQEICATVSALVRAGIPVMGHIGLTPQTAGQLGGYKVQGKDLASARRQVADAKALEEAGAFALVLECIPAPLGRAISQAIAIPTIGIGAGAGCDGQVLVTHDLLGMFDKFTPSFVKPYAQLARQIKEAVTTYHHEVKAGAYPDAKHSFSMTVDIDEVL